MDKPRFQTSSYDFSPEHPSDWQVDPLIGENVQTTLSGEGVVDTSYRKYQYVLTWEAMSKSDYDSLEEVINDHIDNAAALTFTYVKWPQSTSGVSVIGRLSSRKRAGGSGNTAFYSQVTVTLTEVSAR